MTGYGIYLAEIVATVSSDDSRLTVRVIPQMEGIETKYCPSWPCFFKNEIITGKVGDRVWVLCNDEFTIGFILGLANVAITENTSYEKCSLSSSLKDTINSCYRDLEASSLNFNNLLITYWDSACMHCIDRTDGSTLIAYNSGTIVRIKKSEIYAAVRGYGGTSQFRVTPSEINLSADTIRLQSENVILGNNPRGNVMVSTGTLGRNAVPSTTVQA